MKEWISTEYESQTKNHVNLLKTLDLNSLTALADAEASNGRVEMLSTLSLDSEITHKGLLRNVMELDIEMREIELQEPSSEIILMKATIVGKMEILYKTLKVLLGNSN